MATIKGSSSTNPLDARRALVRKWSDNKPCSICLCGHTGDGANSDHRNSLQHGHGACKVEGCKCEHFEWVKWIPEFATELQRIEAP